MSYVALSFRNGGKLYFHFSKFTCNFHIITIVTVTVTVALIHMIAVFGGEAHAVYLPTANESVDFLT